MHERMHSSHGSSPSPWIFADCSAQSGSEVLPNYSSKYSNASSPNVDEQGLQSQTGRATHPCFGIDTAAYSPSTSDSYFDLLSPALFDGNDEARQHPATIRRNRRREQNRES